MHDPEPVETEIDVRRLLRDFALELLIYGFLVVVYFFIVLRVLSGYLTDIFGENLLIYAILGLVLIVLQGVLLDWITTFLLSQIKLDRLD